MGSQNYHSSIREALVERMSNGETPKALYWDTGIPIGTLCRWRRTPGTIKGMPAKPTRPTPPARSTEQWSVGEKLRVLAEVEQTSEADRGQLLRREGVHDADLARWRTELREVLAAQARATRDLTRQLTATQAELREVKALLDLQKKVNALFGPRDEAAGPPDSNER